MPEFLDEVRELVEKGKFAEALDRHLWYHHHILEAHPSQRGVRVSYALSAWRDLGDKYPPAMDALEAERDLAENLVKNSSYRDEAAFWEAASINRVLGDDERSLLLFEKGSDSSKQALWAKASAIALRLERWDLLKQFGLEFQEELSSVERMFKVALSNVPSFPESYKEIQVKWFLERIDRLEQVAKDLEDDSAMESIAALRKQISEA
ncbi:MAG: hypothetical protein AAF226_12750 [Verrucomicrobiota bacterium]